MVGAPKDECLFSSINASHSSSQRLACKSHLRCLNTELNTQSKHVQVETSAEPLVISAPPPLKCPSVALVSPCFVVAFQRCNLRNMIDIHEGNHLLLSAKSIMSFSAAGRGSRSRPPQPLRQNGEESWRYVSYEIFPLHILKSGLDLHAIHFFFLEPCHPSETAYSLSRTCVWKFLINVSYFWCFFFLLLIHCLRERYISVWEQQSCLRLEAAELQEAEMKMLSFSLEGTRKNMIRGQDIRGLVRVWCFWGGLKPERPDWGGLDVSAEVRRICLDGCWGWDWCWRPWGRAGSYSWSERETQS